MSEFFHGWRRKSGGVLLMVATGFVGCWIRSLVVGDFVSFTNRGAEHSLRSVGGRVEWRTIDGLKVNLPMNWQTWPLTDAFRILESDATRERFRRMEYERMKQYAQLNLLQLHTESGQREASEIEGHIERLDRSRIRIWAVWYWSIVIPLTLLSAYLILWPGTRKKPS